MPTFATIANQQAPVRRLRVVSPCCAAEETPESRYTGGHGYVSYRVCTNCGTWRPTRGLEDFGGFQANDLEVRVEGADEYPQTPGLEDL